MERRQARRTVEFVGVTLALVVLSPVVVMVGEPLRRSWMHRTMPRGLAAYGPGRQGMVAVAYIHSPGLAARMVSNPVLIALTAPGRWVADRARPRRWPQGPRGEGPGEPPAGVREPRRPGPAPQAESVALPEPR